jgi:putative membrane protein
MITKDVEFHKKIEDAIGEAEKQTSAEIVVAIAAQSGSYRDVAMLGGLLLLLVGIFLGAFPWGELAPPAPPKAGADGAAVADVASAAAAATTATGAVETAADEAEARPAMMLFPLLHPFLLLLEAAASFLLGYFICRRSATLQRLLSSRRRRAAQANRGSLVAFHEEGVTATKERDGILLYVSLLEGACEVVADQGIEGKVPRARWNEICHALGDPALPAFPARFIEAIGKVGAVLAESFPPGEENPDDIPNRPRIRS